MPEADICVLEEESEAAGHNGSVRLPRILSFKCGRFAYYRIAIGRAGRRGIMRGWPFDQALDILYPIDYPYPAVKARLAKRLVSIVRKHARRNGVRMAAGDYTDFKQFLIDSYWPGSRVVREQYKVLRADNTEWHPSFNDRWLLRHLKGDPANIVKSVTGYDSRAVKRLFWEAMKPYDVDDPVVPKVKRDWPSQWGWCALLRTWLPVDYTQQLLRATHVTAWNGDWTSDVPKLRRFLKRWTPQQILRALTANTPETALSTSAISDTIHMLAQRDAEAPPIPRLPGPKRLHDWLVVERNRRYEHERRERQAERERREQEWLAAMTPEQRAEVEARHARLEAQRKAEEADRNAPLPVEYGEEIDGKIVTMNDGTELTILTPKTPDELASWGAAMHNCIGSYVDYIRREISQIFGVKHSASDKVVDWGIEVCNRRISQFRGVCNEGAPSEVVSLIERALAEADIIYMSDPMAATVGAAYAAHQLAAEEDDEGGELL